MPLAPAGVVPAGASYFYVHGISRGVGFRVTWRKEDEKEDR